MNAAIAIVFLACAAAVAAGQPQQLIVVDPQKFSSAFRIHVKECNDDIAAVLAGNKPVHATPGVKSKSTDGSVKKNEDGSVFMPILLMDGGTRFYQGRGYRLIARKTRCRIGEIDGYLVGPEVYFEPPLANQAELGVSMVRFVAVADVEGK